MVNKNWENEYSDEMYYIDDNGKKVKSIEYFGRAANRNIKIDSILH